VPDQTSTERTASLKQKVVRISAGTVIEVRLQQKGSKKIIGKLGPVSEEGFEVQSAESGTVSSHKVAFADVKSLKEKHGMSRTTKTLVVTGVVLGAVVRLVTILAANGYISQ
jgi:hypothetical protein